MDKQAAAPRWKSGLVAFLILFPLVLTAIVKYLPLLVAQEKISTVSILPPRLYTPKEYYYLSDDVTNRLRSELSSMNEVKVLPSPSAEASAVGEDLAKVASSLGADALIVSTVTIDAGMMQLNVQIVDPFKKKILYNTPFESPLDRYPDMMRAAGAALVRTLQP
jgi:TolB-like protein